MRAGQHFYWYKTQDVFAIHSTHGILIQGHRVKVWMKTNKNAPQIGCYKQGQSLWTERQTDEWTDLKQYAPAQSTMRHKNQIF